MFIKMKYQSMEELSNALQVNASGSFQYKGNSKRAKLYPLPEDKYYQDAATATISYFTSRFSVEKGKPVHHKSAQFKMRMNFKTGAVQFEYKGGKSTGIKDAYEDEYTEFIAYFSALLTEPSKTDIPYDRKKDNSVKQGDKNGKA